MPTSPSTTPTAAINNDLAIEPWLKKLKTVRPSTIKLKYSGRPKAMATRAKAGATSIKATRAKVPAAKEPSAAIPKAGPARPCLALAWPPRHGTTQAAPPGGWARTKVGESAIIEPNQKQ